MTNALVIVLIAVVAIVGTLLVREQRARRHEARLVALLQTFGPLVGRTQDHPQELLTWEPLARAARRLFPAEFDALDGATGGRFPFTRDTLQAAHARWTTAWLSWERAHDDEFKLKAAAIEREIERLEPGAAGEARARLQTVEREKLQRYQDRYAEYVTVSKALAALDLDTERNGQTK